MTTYTRACRKAQDSPTILVLLEIWNEKIAQVSSNKHTPPSVVFNKINNEASLSENGGAMHLRNITARE
jgi:hypothetical protein